MPRSTQKREQSRTDRKNNGKLPGKTWKGGPPHPTRRNDNGGYSNNKK